MLDHSSPRRRGSIATLLLLLVVLLAVSSGCTGEPVATVEPADLVLLGGAIVTLDPNQPRVEALAARDGVIVAMGSSDDMRAYAGEATTVVDLEGAHAYPGFIESHGHFLGMGDSAIQLDLRAATRWADIVTQVEAAAAEAPAGQWIRGRGWHQDKWAEAPADAVEGFPVHAGLSAVSPDNPVILTHASGHATFANAKALALAGVDDQTPDPPGGEILHGPDGAPTGLLRETASGLLARARAADESGSADEAKRMIALASEEALRHGITSFHDAGTPFHGVDALHEAAQAGELGVRLWVMIRDSNAQLAEKLATYTAAGYGDDWMRVGGIKLSIDGALGSRGAWLLEPYSDLPGATGLNLVTIESARETAELALAHDVQLAIHAIGDRANREVLDLFEQVFADNPDKSDLRWRIEHAQHLHPDDLPRFAALGVTASVQGVHCTSDGPWVPDRLGEERSRTGAYMWRTLIDSGALVINGTDAPVESVDPIASYYASVTRQMADGERFYPDQSMTRMEALETYTLRAARAVFEDDRKGSLEVGKLADVTVLSQDLLTVPDEALLDTEVVHTIVGGKVAYSR